MSNLLRIIIISCIFLLNACGTKYNNLSNQEIQNILRQTSCVINDSISEADKTIDVTKDYPEKIIQGSKVIYYEINEKTLSFKTIKDTITEFEQLLWYDTETGKITASFSSIGGNFFGMNYSFNEDGSILSSSDYRYTGNTKICPFQAIALGKKYLRENPNKYSWKLELGTYKKKTIWMVSYNNLGKKKLEERGKGIRLYIDANTGKLIKTMKIRY